MQKDAFVIEERDSYDECVFTIKGRLFSANADELHERLNRALSGGNNNIVVNMREVTFLSSSGIRVLLAAYKRAKKSGGRFVVKNPSENVRNVLGMTALNQMMGERP